jgi:glycine/D-amino acid oxidase-like deaminating enzyme
MALDELPGAPRSLWLDGPEAAGVGTPPLTADLECDVCVIGGGIAGVTTALGRGPELVVDRAHQPPLLLRPQRTELAVHAHGRDPGQCGLVALFALVLEQRAVARGHDAPAGEVPVGLCGRADARDEGRRDADDREAAVHARAAAVGGQQPLCLGRQDGATTDPTGRSE